MKPLRNTPLNLLKASLEERREFLESFDFVLTDCDGTLWDLHRPFVGVGEAIQALRDHGKKVVFVTNNVLRSQESYDEFFTAYKFNATYKDDVIHPGTAAIDYLRSVDFKGKIYLIGASPLRKLLIDAGFDVIVEDAWSPIPETATALYQYVTALAKEKVSAVFVEVDINMTVKQLLRAQMLLTGDPECLFLVGLTDSVVPTPKPIMGLGPLIKVVEEFTQRKATVVGKPGVALRDVIIAKFNITDPKRILFVGDMLEQDIGFGNSSGFRTLFVPFPKTEELNLSFANPNEIPDYCLPAFADFSKLFDDLQSSAD